jgi:hypothetical protein
LNYYLHELVELPTVSACISECVIAWKGTKLEKEDSMVDMAISSVALAIFSRTQEHHLATKEAIVRYGRLLWVARVQVTQAELSTYDEKDLEECLMTVVLMGWYESIMHRPLNFHSEKTYISPHSWSHYDGAMAILKI